MAKSFQEWKAQNPPSTLTAGLQVQQPLGEEGDTKLEVIRGQTMTGLMC